ncbi:unnamed protein product [Schistosoma margrebowiei]|uniref:Uncharacterized protein n=1 Tax=Schistosoma margrebowiei TaxID=48269 RepID=A0A183LXN0_9TREM|nr:unnamed protein product [Schistosoma margrebowiei]
MIDDLRGYNSCHDEIQSQGQSNLCSSNSDSYSRVNMKGVSTWNNKANHKGEIKFGKCLSYGKFHSRNSCAFRNAKCFKCGKIGHIQSVCKTAVHFASGSTKSYNLDLNNSDVSSYHLSMSTILKGNAHIQKRLYTSPGLCHDFIVNIGSIESIISFMNLKSLDLNVVLKPVTKHSNVILAVVGSNVYVTIWHPRNMELRKEERKNSTNAALSIFVSVPNSSKTGTAKYAIMKAQFAHTSVMVGGRKQCVGKKKENIGNMALETLDVTDKHPLKLSDVSESEGEVLDSWSLGGEHFQDDYHGPEKCYDCCPTLKLLIDSGHVMVFTWKNGCEPEHIEESDDFVPFLLQQEKMKVNQLSMEMSQNVFTDSNVPSELNEILWDENEVGAIDFGPFDVESVENIEIERENMVSTSSSGMPDNPNIDSASQSNVPSSVNERKPTVASGASARYLLDSADGRQALLNDLLELNAFLQRFQEDLLERLDNESEHQFSRTGCNAFKSSGGICCDTIQNIIIQNAPNDLSYTSNDISKMIELVKEALNKLTTSSLSQLMMIRTRIGYLDRLTDRLLDYRRQVELARTRCSQTQKLIDKALMEQQEKTTQLAQLKNCCKKLVSFVSFVRSTQYQTLVSNHLNDYLIHLKLHTP